MLSGTKKIKDYAGAEVHETSTGSYVLIKGDAHSGPYESIKQLESANGRDDMHEEDELKKPKGLK